jgi:hypothetical protein
MATLAVTNDFSAGTTIVAADMNENFSDIETFINSTPGVVQEDIVDAVGDILHGDAANSVGKLAVGTNNHILTADSAISGVGIKWAAAPTPTDITVADTTDTTCYVGLWESATGDLAPKTDGGATYNAGTGTLTATAFAGPLTGNVTGNASGTAATVTGAAQSAITSVGTLTGLTMGGELAVVDEVVSRPEMKDYAETVNAVGGTGGGTQDFDIALGNVHTATVDTSTNTFTFSNPSATGKSCSFTLILTNGGSQTVNWPGAVDWAGGTAPTLTTAGIDILTFMTIDAGTIWYGFLAGADMQ